MSQRTRRWRARSNRGRSRRVLVEVVIVGAQRLPSAGEVLLGGSLLACPKPTFALPYRDPFSESSATCSPDLLLSPSSSRPPLCAVCQPQLPNLDRTSAPRTTPGRVRAGQATSPKHAQNQHAPAHPHSTRIHASACPASLLLYLTGVLPSGKTPPPSSPLLAAGPGRWLAPPLYTAPLRTRAGDRVTPRHGHERSVNLAHL
jgi:hypothetical protein